jgi:tRNA(Ile)-lysidine synthase
VKALSRLPDKVGRFFRDLDTPADGLVVAVSGGPDSVALARALATAGIVNALILAHLNHCLRGADSDADESFVRELSISLATRFRCERLDVAAQARAEGGNLESVARRLRYRWLAEVARQEGASFVATGHTADDQAETVLHRLLRGTGLQGLRGLASRRTLAPGVEVLRPLLAVTRAEVLAYLAAAGQPFRQDRSNLDPHYTRNRIRHELLPQLAREYNPAIASVLCRLAESAGAVFAGQEGRTAGLLAEAERPRAGSLVVLERQRLAAAPRHLVREVFRLVWAREGWPQGAMDFAAWDRLAGLIFDEAAATDLPGGVRARRRGRVVQVGPES